MALALAAADAVVVPSTQDNLPNMAVEAFACGRPCVGFAVGGLPEIVEDGANGRLAPPLDSRRAGGRRSPGSWRTRNGGARWDGRLGRRPSRTFDLRLVARRYADLYAEVLDATRGAAEWGPETRWQRRGATLAPDGRSRASRSSRRCATAPRRSSARSRACSPRPTPSVEHVVIDGASSDGTVDGHPSAMPTGWRYWRSEPDRGISDAFNKGVAAARGDCDRPAQRRRLAGAGAGRARGRRARAAAAPTSCSAICSTTTGRARPAVSGSGAIPHYAPRDRSRHAGRQSSDHARAPEGLRAWSAGSIRRYAFRDGLRLAAARPSRGLSRRLRAGRGRPHDARRRVRSRLRAGAGRGAGDRGRPWRARGAGRGRATSIGSPRGRRSGRSGGPRPPGSTRCLRRWVNPGYEPYRPGGRR